MNLKLFELFSAGPFLLKSTNLTITDLSAVHQATAAAAQANLVRQQEELERKAAELEQKEQELQNRSSRVSNPGGKAPPVFFWSCTEKMPEYEHQFHPPVLKSVFLS